MVLPERRSACVFDEGASGFRVCLGEVSTSEAIALFDASTPITIVSFGATCFARFGFATEKDLPPIPTAGAARAFLDAHGQIGLVEFEALLGEGVSIHSHENGNCQLRCRDRSALLFALRQVVPEVSGPRVVHTLVANPGYCVSVDATGTFAMRPTSGARLTGRPRRRGRRPRSRARSPACRKSLNDRPPLHERGRSPSSSRRVSSPTGCAAP